MKGFTRSSRKKTPSYRRQFRRDGNDLAFVEIAERRHYLGRYDTPDSREKYHRLIAEWEASGSVHSNAPKDMSIVELVSLYLKWASVYYVKDGKPTTEVRNIRLAMRSLRRLYGGLPACEFGPKALKTVRQAMVETGTCRRYINHQIGLVKRMLRWAVEEELIPPGIYHGVQAVRGLTRGRCNARESDPVRPAPVELIGPVKEHVSRPVAAMSALRKCLRLHFWRYELGLSRIREATPLRFGRATPDPAAVAESQRRFAICQACEHSRDDAFACDLYNGCCLGRFRAATANHCPENGW